MIKLNFRRGSAFASKKAHKYLETINPEDIKNICVIRHAAIGDMVVMRPVILEMKKHFPNAHITLSLIASSTYGAPTDLVDNVHIVSKNNDDGTKTSFLNRIKQIQQLPPQDIIFDMADSSLSLLINIITPTKLKVGYPYRWIRRLFYDIATLRSDFVLETESMMHQLNVFGFETKYFPYDYDVSTVTRDKENPYIIYFAGASVKSKCWDESNFVELLKRTTKEYPQYQHIILKGIKEDEQFENIYEPFKDVSNVVHQEALPLEKIYDYLAGASLLVSGDTGIRNMAIATHTPTIGIMLAFGASPMRYYPRLDIHNVVYNLDLSQPNVDRVYQIFKKCIQA